LYTDFARAADVLHRQRSPEVLCIGECTNAFRFHGTWSIAASALGSGCVWEIVAIWTHGIYAISRPVTGAALTDQLVPRQSHPRRCSNTGISTSGSSSGIELHGNSATGDSLQLVMLASVRKCQPLPLSHRTICTMTSTGQTNSARCVARRATPSMRFTTRRPGSERRVPAVLVDRVRSRARQRPPCTGPLRHLHATAAKGVALVMITASIA